MDEIAGLDVVWDSPVLRITLDRPEAANSLTRPMTVGICEALDQASLRSDVRVVLLRANGANFCTGADLKEANAPTGERPRVGHLQRGITSGFHRMIRAFAEVQLPVVAGVQGYASGAGLSLALSADYLVTRADARFWVPYVSRGFSPDSGSTYLLPRLIGPNRAKEMILLARKVDAARALDWGMVNEVVSAELFDAHVEAAAQGFAEAATVAVGLAKNLVNRNLDANLSEALANEVFAEELAVRSQDFKEGITSFLGRRDAKFSGQ